MSIFPRFAGFPVLLAVLASTVFSQETEEAAAARAQQLATMKQVAAMIDLLGDGSQADSVVKLLDKPVLRYSDVTRKSHDSSLWIWSSGGRPAAILAIEFYPDYRNTPSWLFEIASLSTNKIGARNKLGLNWTAKKPGIELLPIKDAPAPSAKAPTRLAQMRDLQRRFKAHESGVIEGRIELRAMTSPLFRYADTDAGVIDGAIFAFATGTNPEVLLVLEAQAVKDGEPQWRYALAQMTGGALTVELDEAEVWKCVAAEPPAIRDGYINGWIKVEDVPKE